MAMLFTFILVLCTMLVSEVGALQKPSLHLAFNSGDSRIAFEKTFCSQDLIPPPLRFYQSFDQPFKSHERVFTENDVFELYSRADKRAKAVALYAAAHSFDDRESVDQLTKSEWKELLGSLLSSREHQDRMIAMIGRDARRMPQKSNDWFPKFPFQEDSPLAAWRQDSHSNSEMIATLDENDPPVQVCQLGTNCYMVAAVLFLAYNHKHHSPPGSPWERIPMEDIMSYSVNQRTIYNRVVENRGLLSRKFTEELMQIPDENALVKLVKFKSTTDISPSSPLAQDIFHFLRVNGAGLIGLFRVGEDFFDPQKFSYDGRPQLNEEDVAAHAMVLVGARRDTVNNKVWLLVQNSWAQKQFVEMSLEYFKHCGEPELFFPREKIEMKHDFQPISQPLCGEYLINDGGDDAYMRPEYEVEEDDISEEDLLR